MIALATAEIATIFKSLEGRWTLDRRIEPAGHFRGEARFTPHGGPDSLLYREDGVLEQDGRQIPGYREFFYRLADDRIEIDFAEPHRRGQPYVALSFVREGDLLVARAEHRCAPDHYRHEMRWQDADQFMTDIRVSGPAKDYRLITRYQRIA